MTDFSDHTSTLEHMDGLYVPENERQLRRVQKRSDELEKQVRSWAETVINILPHGLPMNSHEVYLLSLFLAQQQRLNIQMDAREPDYSTLAVIKNSFLNFLPREDPAIAAMAHRIVSQRLDSEIERGCAFYCRDHNIDANSDPALDWRVAIRFMAQSIYSRISETAPRRIAHSPRRFELALVARDLATVIETKRHMMIGSFPTGPVGAPEAA